MKVLLLKDVKGKGKAGEVINLNEGYARNFIIPNGLGKEADKQTINAVNIKMAADAHRKDVEKAQAKELAKEIEKLSVTIVGKAGANGKFFGAVTGKEISDALKEQHNIDIDKKKVVLKDAIKAAGEYNVTLKVYSEVSATLKVIVKVG